MTRSITIVNTSNWDGEDYEVEFDVFGSTEVGCWGKRRKFTLKPGEYANIVPQGSGKFTKVESKKPEPFMVNGRQILPTVAVGFSGGKEINPYIEDA